MTRHLFTACLCASLLVAGCSSNSPGVGQEGDSCGDTRGCGENLTCRDGTCVVVVSSDDTDSGVPQSGRDASLQPHDASLSAPADAGKAHFDAAAGFFPDAAGSFLDASAATGSDASSSSCGTCLTPPDACHATQGRCQAGQCVYDLVVGAPCDDGNACTVDDTCTAQGCVGTPKPCTNPPAPVCISGTDLRTYDATGSCQGGVCVYAKHTIACGAGGCVNDACQTDPCASVTCQTPPSSCYASPGTCQAGSCTYPFADGTSCDDANLCTTTDQCNAGVCRGVPVACTVPPASTCQNASTAKVYNAVGTCAPADGTCSYSFQYVTCPSGCANGQCDSSGWAPMNSNSNTDLYGVWGTSASSVWAVGDGGAILYYNGAIWQTRSSPVTEVIVSIHGSAPDNIAALAFSDGYDSQLDVLRYDGTSWTKLGSVNNTYYANTSCLFTYGPNDVFVYSTYWDIAGQASKGQLHRIKNGVVTQLLANGPVSGESGCGLWVFSPTNVLIGAIDVQKWDGTQLTAVGSGSPYSNGLFAFSPTSVFAKGNPPTYWDGQSWSNLTTAFQGTVTGLHGTSASRIFASAYYYSGATQSDFGAALFYDGLGWTQEALPSGTLSLNGIWAAPTGEVFAVGNHGTIVKGP